MRQHPLTGLARIYVPHNLLNVAYCGDEKAWHTVTKRLKLPDPYPASAGQAWLIDHEKTKTRFDCVIVTVKRPRVCTPEVAGVCTHEATHVWQWLAGEMEEDKPSIEFEAYSIEAIAVALLQAHLGWPRTARASWADAAW